MLLIGDKNCIPNYLDNLVVFNLTSLVEGVEKVNLLPPQSSDYINQTNPKEFDMFYMNYIFSSDYVFMELMKIIYNLYLHNNVYILIYRNDTFDIVAESLMKLIQQRYGYHCQWLNEPSDFNYYDDSTFSFQGVYNLDIDRERYENIMVATNAQAIMNQPD